eukprot:scaffold122436_cov52-Phaeocystis_antarctica.AAC.5
MSLTSGSPRCKHTLSWLLRRVAVSASVDERLSHTLNVTALAVCRLQRVGGYSKAYRGHLTTREECT